MGLPLPSLPTAAPAPARPEVPFEVAILLGRDGRYARATLGERGTCPRCQGRGTVEVPELGRWGRCRCRLPHDAVASWNAARVPAQCSGYTLDAWDPRHDRDGLHARALRWAETGERGVYLWGAPGVGKTHLAVGMAWDWVRTTGRSFRFVDLSHLTNAIRARSRAGATVAGEVEPLDQVARAELVLLDDLGVPSPTDFDRSIADELVTRLYNAASRVLVTSNCELAEHAGESLTPRAASRLRELCESWELRGSDYRMRRGAP